MAAAGERPLNACLTSHGEQALYRHPAVAEAGAFGVADPAEGQVPIAYLVFKPGQHATEAEIKRFLAGHRSPRSRSRSISWRSTSSRSRTRARSTTRRWRRTSRRPGDL